MQFAKALRAQVRAGAITQSVRVWKLPRVKIGGRYRFEDDWITVDDVVELNWEQVDDPLARSTGFADRQDLLRTARHGQGDRVFLITFHWTAG